MAFVYSPFRAIDADDCVLYSAALCYSEGWVFLQHLYFNFVGNGSALLARTAHVREVGGYDPGLQAGGAQGCEDILLQARLAARYRVGVVPEYLIGYRLGGGRMSAQRERMFRSRELAEARLLAEIPDVPARVRAWSRGAHTLNRSQSLFTESGWRAAAGSLLAAVRYDPLGVLDRIAALAPGRLRRLLDSSLPRGFPGTGRPFLDWRPDEPHSGPLRPIVLRRLAQLAALDESRGAYVQTGANHERAACDDISGS
ncbi:MAG: hypothetical protein IH616_13860 [Gemmatimonadales bacterium]|nr:hypothetical protein [Gemmatimonadales bacterium]